EMFYEKKFKSLEELAKKIVEYIEFYNERRFQKKLGCMAPIEYATIHPDVHNILIKLPVYLTKVSSNHGF
ncbi:MAG: IS3 family transposase, partial [Firmicutes bacterium]|nr:IS3 family transposase [Bacillota bacterium]